MRAALNSYPPETPTGLGTMARDFLALMPFKKLFQRHRIHLQSAVGWNDPGLPEVHASLEDVEAVVALERPMPSHLFREAKAAGKRTVLVVMHEWIDHHSPWLPYTDLFVAPNAICYRKLVAIGLESRTKLLHLPLDLSRLPFTLRTKADRFVFSNGWGGCAERKGWPEMRDALLRMDKVTRGRFRVQSQVKLANVPNDLNTSAGPTATVLEMYDYQDVAIVPSRLEGFGYSVFEPMAMGLPVMTTDAEPMRDAVVEAYESLSFPCLLTAYKEDIVMKRVLGSLVEHRPCCPSALVKCVENMHEYGPVTLLSYLGRQWIERHMGQTAVDKLWEAITSC